MPRAKKNQTSRVEILVPFNGMYRGDTANVVVDATVQGWINAGLARLTEAVNGTDQAGPSSAVADDPGSLTVGAGDGSAASDEPSEGFGAGGYGAFEG